MYIYGNGVYFACSEKKIKQQNPKQIKVLNLRKVSYKSVQKNCGKICLETWNRIGLPKQGIH